MDRGSAYSHSRHIHRSIGILDGDPGRTHCKRPVRAHVGARRGNLVFSTLVMAAFLLSALFALQISLSSDGPAHGIKRVQTPMMTLVLTPHDSIFINGDGDFTSAHGVTGGSGTPSDPYIIEGWNISAASAMGIQIQDTVARFVVSSCFIHDGVSTYLGIYMVNCTNGILVNNTCQSNLFGINIYSSRNDTLINNSCNSNFFAGICLSSSDDNTLNDNSCSSNSFDGIDLSSSSNNTLNGNSCKSNENHGAHLEYSSDNNTLVNNNCSSNKMYGVYLSSSAGNIMTRNQICSNPYGGAYISSGSSSNIVFKNTFTGNHGSNDTYNSLHVQASDGGTGNWWNGTDGRGNYWCDWTTPDANHDGIVDIPYNITGSAGSKDYYPLTTVQTQIPEFGMMPFVAMVLLAAIVLTRGARRRKSH